MMYKFNENLSAYGNWMQGLITGQEVGKKYANKGQYLDPAKTTQRELGIKWDKGNLGGTVSYFHVNQQIAQKDPLTNIFDYNAPLDPIIVHLRRPRASRRTRRGRRGTYSSAGGRPPS